MRSTLNFCVCVYGVEIGVQVLFFPNTYKVSPEPLVERTILFPTELTDCHCENHWLYTCGSISELSILFHLAIYLHIHSI